MVWNADGSDLVVGADGLYTYDETVGLRTVNSVSAAVTPLEAGTSLALFTVLYLLLTAVWIMVLDKKIRSGPDPVSSQEADSDGEGFRKATADRQHARLSEGNELAGGTT